MTTTHPEYQYLDLIRRIIEKGFYRPSPHAPLPGKGANPGTYTLINQNMEFDLSTGQFPLMTLRQAFFKSILKELLWFLSGSTDNADLKAMKAGLWNPWDTPDTNQSIGWAPGQLGPIYGKQWRHWRATMSRPDGTLDSPGFDQITNLVEGIKSAPHSKRLFVSSYDPQDAKDCFVTTCHGTFFVSVFDDRLNLHQIQRSGDVPVGIPYNIASYSLLIYMLAQVTGLQPGTLYHTISDAHVYGNQVPAMRSLLEREPLPYPSVRINPDVKDIFAFTVEDFELVGYEHQGPLDVPVAV